MDFWNFIKEGIDGEFHFLPERGANDEESSPSTSYVRNEALVIDVEPLTIVHPHDLLRTSVIQTMLPQKKIRKQTDESFEKEPRQKVQKVQKVPPQVSRAYGDASDP
nr:hypothetical protein [Tanacetum cinerariifolium]